ncbi:MAG: S41 family peptidase, partial [Bacteroidales bacterium]|nr:S41 family peptidase [Bacteroidales bacterium]
MSKISFLITTLLFLLMGIVEAQEKWNFQIMLGENDFGPINTFMHAKFDHSNTLHQLHSAPDADKRIFGPFKTPLLRLFKKFAKKGILLTINDIEVTHNTDGSDSLKGSIFMPMLGKGLFKGVRVNDSISGSFFSKAYHVPVHLDGFKTTDNARFDYSNLPEKISDTTQKYLFNTVYLNTRKWNKFMCRIEKLAKHAEDDLDLFFGFNLLIGKLPFSHFNLMFGDPSGETPDEEDALEQKTTGNVFYEKLTEHTALLEVKSFGGGALEMDSVFSIVQNQQFENLIIDLRDNGGGGLTSANVLGGYLIEEEVSIGYFVTNKWYGQMGEDNLEFEILPVTKEVSTEGLRAELMHSRGCELVVHPGEKQYSGNIYILTHCRPKVLLKLFIKELSCCISAIYVKQSCLSREFISVKQCFIG